MPDNRVMRVNDPDVAAILEEKQEPLWGPCRPEVATAYVPAALGECSEA
ncbi:hypothetical protein CO731_00146 [Aminobacter sp. MSH1]|nr:hypothetical protein CO731_00146 [Aminobacter sp. MSH1]